MTKIRSGQTFLYRSAGYDSTIIEIRMKEKVTGSYLQVALTDALKRFPYMAQKLVEKDGSYYLHRDDVSMTVMKTRKFRVLGSMSTGYHLIDITYTENLIRVAFHHGLCDGRGVMPFVETLLYLYCCQKYKRKFSSEGIRLPGEPVPPEETLEPFGREHFPVDGPAEAPPDFGEGFALPESTLEPDACYHTEFLLNEGEFVRAAKSVGATPALFAAILLSRCVRKLNSQAEQPVLCNLAMDLRAAVGMEQTHRNCVGSVAFPFTAEDEKRELPEIAKEYRRLLSLQRDPDLIRAGLNRQIDLFNRLDTLGTLEEKRKLMSIFDSMINHTYVISYMGRLRTNNYAEHIDSARFYSDTIRGLTMNMISAGGKLSMELLQGFPEVRYAEAFGETLKSFGMLSSSGTEPIVTGRDKSYITASRQAERYYAEPEER